jgi:hypothetical protein
MLCWSKYNSLVILTGICESRHHTKTSIFRRELLKQNVGPLAMSDMLKKWCIFLTWSEIPSIQIYPRRKAISWASHAYLARKGQGLCSQIELFGLINPTQCYQVMASYSPRFSHVFLVYAPICWADYWHMTWYLREGFRSRGGDELDGVSIGSSWDNLLLRCSKSLHTWLFHFKRKVYFATPNVLRRPAESTPAVYTS